MQAKLATKIVIQMETRLLKINPSEVVLNFPFEKTADGECLNSWNIVTTYGSDKTLFKQNYLKY